jgi:hypothetical protein
MLLARVPRSAAAHSALPPLAASVLAVALLLGGAAPAAAEPVRCQREIATQSAKLVQARVKALQKCRDAVVKGTFAGPCPDAKAGAKIAKAESKLGAAIAKACGGADRICGAGGDDDALGAIGWTGGSCQGLENAACVAPIADCGGIASCLTCVGAAAVDQAIGLAYDDLGGGGGAGLLGCRRAIGREAARLVQARSKALHKCRDGALKGGPAGPCPDLKALTKVGKATAKLDAKICKACGGADRACGTGDDLAPAAIGFAAACPDVTVPGGPSCGGPIDDLRALVDCVACVTAFKTGCADALAVPGLTSYPAECAPPPAPTPTPTGTPTPPPGAPTATPTATPAPTPTATPFCGNDVRDPGEACDGADAPTCPGLCQGDCTCPSACILPDPLPAIVSFVARPATDLDTGWTGISHDLPGVDGAPLTAARLGACDLDPGSPACGRCEIEGPIAFPAAAKSCACFNVGTPDTSTLAACDPEAPACAAPETCECFYGAPLPISAGGVPVCVVNRYTGPVAGTVNIADAGPHAGEGAVRVELESSVHSGLLVEQPCPLCEGDPVARDGVAGGTCRGGVRDGAACDVGGTNELFGPLSLDCLPSSAGDIGKLQITFDPLTTGTTSLGAALACTAPGFGGFACFCDTCATAEAEPCRSDADCPGGAACGGRRCQGGANAGAPCAVGADCPGGLCGRPGFATRPNQCDDAVCSPNPADPAGPDEGVCEAGPNDQACSREPFRGCLADADCNPPPLGTCATCAPGQACHSRARECFPDPIVRTGAPGVQAATAVATFCIPPTASQSVNQVSGLPGPGALALPIRVFRSGALCGNGVLDAGESCDPPADAACPGACQPDCTCATCGDGLVNAPGEECDGADDALCPGTCQPDCTCAAGTCGNGVAELGEQCDGDDAAACPGACRADCTCGPVCGNGVVEDAEECDGAGSTACPPAACLGDCTCGPFCGDGVVDPGEACDGTGAGVCPGTCEADCTCSPFCGNGVREAGELCDGADDALCPGACTSICTCPGQGRLTLVVTPGSDLDTGWTGTAHDFSIQTGSTISGELSNCDGETDFECDFFANVGSFCSADPSRACTNNNQCSGAGSCVIQTYGPPLPLSAGGVPACIVNRFATDVLGTYNLQTGDSELRLRLSSLVHLGSAVSQPCPICDCGKPNVQDCQIGEGGTCAGILGSPPCTVQGTGPFGPTSNHCPPSSSLNVSGGGLDIPFEPVTTGTVTFPSNQPCDASGFQSQSCWCDGQPQPSSCLNACDGGANDGQPCDGDAECPGAPAGACKPLCRQIAGEAIGEGECVAGPVVQTCAGAPEIGCQTTSGCPAGKGPCVARNQRCFMDPIVRVGTPGTTSNVGAAAFCIPATSGTAINQTAGLPGPGAITFPNAVSAVLCGDGIVNQVREECDGGDDANCPGACLPNCTCDRTCGNGVAEFGEQCDPGGPGGNPPADDDACPGQCAVPGSPAECRCPPVCGDGFVGPGEECDPGGPGGDPPPSDAVCPGVCLAGSCQCPLPPLPQCGNGVLDPGEACDLPAVGCGPLQTCLLCQECFPPPDIIPPETGFICGNLNIEPTEVCEQPAIRCGDGEVCAPLTCDQCIPLLPGPVCGNLNIETGEACELPAVGCGSGELCLLCQECIPFFPVCGNLNLEPGEACELPAIGCGPLQVCLLCLQCVP